MSIAKKFIIFFITPYFSRFNHLRHNRPIIAQNRIISTENALVLNRVF